MAEYHYYAQLLTVSLDALLNYLDLVDNEKYFLS